jgi:1-acyl-sn-glycerol-3-phosphate acyltransferase
LIPARKSRWFTNFFARHAHSRIKRTFGRVLVSGLDDLRASCARGPVLVVANHTSWWDPLIALWLTNVVLRTDSYAMMDAANLRRLPFFGKVGAFGVDLADRGDGARAVRHAARLLSTPGRIVWIYPEGRERSAFDPLELQPGSALVARIVRRAEVTPIGVRYVFGNRERPDIWIAIGRPMPPARDLDVEHGRQRDGIASALAQIDSALGGSSTDGFTILEDSSGPGVLSQFSERMLAWLVRRF